VQQLSFNENQFIGASLLTCLNEPYPASLLLRNLSTHLKTPIMLKGCAVNKVE